MHRIRLSTPEDGALVVAIWEAAVDATHDFLSAEDRRAIGEQVREFLPQAPLWLAVNETGRPDAFMLLSDGHVDALFVDPAVRATGIGRMLLDHARNISPDLTTDVNEQNPQAIGFYERIGFTRIGRSPTDDQGRPYPLIHMRLEAAPRIASADRAG